MQNQPPYTPGGPLSTGHYEFSDEENQQIELTGARARMWGWVSLITGGLALVGLIVSLVFKNELIVHGLDPSYVTIFVVSLMPIVLTHLVISMLYVGAGKSLQAVVATQGNDIEHLMQSLDKLGTAFLVEFAIGMLAIVITVGTGVQMAVDNVASQKAAELAKSAAENERIDAAAEEDGDEDEGDTDEEDEDSDAEADADADAEGDEESAEADEADDGDTDEEADAEDEEGGSGEAADEEEDEAEDEGGEDSEDGAVEDLEESADEPTPEPAEEPVAG